METIERAKRFPAGTGQRRQRRLTNVCRMWPIVKVVGAAAASDVLVAGRKAAVYPGGELIVAAKVAAPGHTSLLVEGTFLGEKVAEEYPLEATGTGELAGRGWGEIAVASLLLTFLATIYPALQAAKTQPAEALRYE